MKMKGGSSPADFYISTFHMSNEVYVSVVYSTSAAMLFLGTTGTKSISAPPSSAVEASKNREQKEIKKT